LMAISANTLSLETRAVAPRRSKPDPYQQHST
jgi:hypothetical protein